MAAGEERSGTGPAPPRPRSPTRAGKGREGKGKGEERKGPQGSAHPQVGRWGPGSLQAEGGGPGIFRELPLRPKSFLGGLGWPRLGSA